MTARSNAIDGLRTVAALSILFLHIGFSPFAGGFIGVDVFFVISGYLITAKIRREVETTGRFDFAAFYAGRLARLYPALLVTIAASFVAAYFLMSPAETKAFAASALAALTWVSNVHFWLQGGYFDAASITKPLLHTWSLSVEEQFYILWPLCLVVALNTRRQWVVLAVIVALALLSFYLNLEMADGAASLAGRFAALADRLNDGASMIYYLSPFRVFEFAIGGLVVWLDRFVRPGSANTVASIVGGALVAASIWRLNENAVFPSYNALYPCVGAALLILGRSAWVARAILGNWIMAGIGRRTYSIYLAHWPIIVFYSYIHVGPVSLWEQFALCLVSIGAGFLLYAAVEVPFYSGRLRIKAVFKVFVAAFAASLVLIVPALSAGQNGWDWRIDPKNRELVATASKQIGARFDGMLSRDCFPSGGDGNYPADFPASTCMNYQVGKDNVLLLGDSIAAYSYAGLQQNGGVGVNIMQNTLSGCRPLIGWGTRNCQARNADFYDHLDRYHFDTLLLSAYWEEKDLPAIEATAKFLSGHGIKAIIIGPSLRFSRNLPDIFAAAQTPAAALSKSAQSILPGLFDLDDAIGKIATASGLAYFSPLSRLCSTRAESSCQVVIDDKYLVSFDTHHFMRPSAAYVFKGIPL